MLLHLWRHYVSKHLKLLSITLVLMVIEGASLGAVSYLIRPLFDEVMVAADINAISWVAIGIFLAFFARALSGFGQRLMTVTIGLRVVNALQKDLVAHLLKLDTAFFLQHSPGALIERVRGDSQALQGLASTALMTLGRDVFSLVALLAVAIYNDWLWTLIALIGVPLLILPVMRLQKRIRQTTRHARQSSAQISNRLDEIFHGIKAIKLNNLAQYETGRFNNEVDRFLSAQRRSEASKAGVPAMIDLIAGFGLMAVVYFGGQQIIGGEKSLGEFMSFFVAMGLIFDPLRRLGNLSGLVQAALASLERLYELFAIKPTILDTPAMSSASLTKPQDILFEKVHFAYGDVPVLNGLSLRAPAGKITALVGSSGAGKTTVFNLLTRLIEADSGQISLGKNAINQFSLEQLRNLFAVVSQESALFDETLSQNIALGDLNKDEAAILQAAEQALVTDFTDANAMGLAAPAGPRGSNLSGGQRQRIIIARAILRDAPFLLLDEATSALDNHTEQRLQHVLNKIAHNKTTLVIAHRLSTVQDADLIHVMEAGQVVESGTHESLLAQKGAYYQLHSLLK